MEMANALLYIAGALMMGLGALGAACRYRYFRWPLFGRCCTSTRAYSYAAYPILRGDGLGRCGADDCCRYCDVRSVCGGALIRHKRQRII